LLKQRKEGTALKGTILCIGTLDTKGLEIQYLKELIEKKGYATLVMDVSGLGEPFFTPDITAEEIARAAGSAIQEVRGFKEAGPAAEIMTSGVRRLVKDLYDTGKFQGVVSVGGGVGTAIASSAMRELPIGVPKFVLCTQKIVQAGIKGYVGTKDIVMMPSPAFIAGLNRLTRKALSQAAGAIVGMVESFEPEVLEKPLVFMTNMGTTRGGLKVKSLLEDKGFEVIVFHAVGVGGMTFEELLKSYPVRGVIEFSLTEIGNELFGGFSPSGPERLETAGKKGIPQIIIPGNVDFISFLGPETVPERYKDRKICFHNRQSTLPRLNAEELKLLGETVAKKLNLATGPVKVLIPIQGFSAMDREGCVLYDPEADKAFVVSLKNFLRQDIELKEIDAHINDDEFAEAVVDEFIDVLGI
jgi:uncharacterized protein (UPF0261 family)